MATHSSTLAWKIPWTEEPGRLQSMGPQRVGHDWATSLSFPFIQTTGGDPETICSQRLEDPQHCQRQPPWQSYQLPSEPPWEKWTSQSPAQRVHAAWFHSHQAQKQEQLMYGIKSQAARTGGDWRAGAPATVMFSFSTPMLVTQTRGKLVEKSPCTRVPFSLHLLCVNRS